MMDIRERFARIRKQYIGGSGDRLREIEGLLDRLAASRDGEALSRLMLHFHALAGSGSTYGFPRVTRAAGRGEEEADALCRSGGFPGKDDLGRWEGYLREIRGAFEAPGNPSAAEPGGDGDPSGCERVLQEVLVVDDDGDLAAVLRDLLAREGFGIRVVSTHAALEAFRHGSPSAVVVDTGLDGRAGYDLVRKIRELPEGKAVPVVVISVITNLLNKVGAIQSGADAFFEKPVDFDALARKLSHFLARDSDDPPRILAVDDDSDQASFLRMVLESAGYEVHVCSDPTRFEQDLGEFQPDLIVMDVLLPGISGYDLVRILRLEDRYSALPVVFLTTRGQVASQIEGARAGGDAYLVKPVSPGLLLSVVSVKLDRGRLLKSLLDRDGLTRLLTHSAFMDQARVIWEKCRRKEGPCAVLVMIDLDHFKAVNDTHGHPVGDRVLTNLARFLRKRLRGSDLIGRYGGEEFALIIEDLDAEVAAGMVERLREEFAGLEHDAYDGRKIRVTFSAGVAPLERKLKDLADWTRRADDALYEAKMAGRNRVAVSSPALEGSEEVAPARGVGEGA